MGNPRTPNAEEASRCSVASIWRRAARETTHTSNVTRPHQTGSTNLGDADGGVFLQQFLGCFDVDGRKALAVTTPLRGARQAMTGLPAGTAMEGRNSNVPAHKTPPEEGHTGPTRSGSCRRSAPVRHPPHQSPAGHHSRTHAHTRTTTLGQNAVEARGTRPGPTRSQVPITCASQLGDVGDACALATDPWPQTHPHTTRHAPAFLRQLRTQRAKVPPPTQRRSLVGLASWEEPDRQQKSVHGHTVWCSVGSKIGAPILQHGVARQWDVRFQTGPARVLHASERHGHSTHTRGKDGGCSALASREIRDDA